MATFNLPLGITVDPAGDLYVTDYCNATVRKITPAGVVSTFAGRAGVGGYAEGNGSAARFNGPHGLTIDSAGNLYVADAFNHRIRKTTPSGDVSTVAGLDVRVGPTGREPLRDSMFPPESRRFARRPLYR